MGGLRDRAPEHGVVRFKSRNQHDAPIGAPAEDRVQVVQAGDGGHLHLEQRLAHVASDRRDQGTLPGVGGAGDHRVRESTSAHEARIHGARDRGGKVGVLGEVAHGLRRQVGGRQEGSRGRSVATVGHVAQSAPRG